MRKREDSRKMFVDRQQYPSFSSTLLEKIYSSIDEGGDRAIRFERPAVFYRLEAEINKKKADKTLLQETCFLMEKKTDLQKSPPRDEMGTKQGTNHRDFDHDGICFSSSSCSSESSSGGFSSSESESAVGVNKTRASCFAPLRLKPVRTKAPEKSNKSEQGSPKQIHHSGRSKELKILEQLKKSKQPISPGGRLVNFINSLFSSSGSSVNKRAAGKKGNGSGSGSPNNNANRERKIFPSQASSCSSVPLSARSCLSKHPNSTTSDRVRNEPPRSVRFHPVSVIVDEDSRPCHSRREGAGVGLVPISVPKSGTMGRTQSRRTDQGRPTSQQLVENIRCNRVEEHPKTLLRDHQPNRNTISTLHHSSKGRQSSCRVSKDVNDDDDDVISCSSSDLFELPVYESTRPDPSRPIY